MEDKIKEAEKKTSEKPEEKKRFIDKTDSFFEEIKSYFNKNKIIIKNSEIIRKMLKWMFFLSILRHITVGEHGTPASRTRQPTQ